MSEDLKQQLRQLVPEFDQSAHRELFESSRGRSGANRTLTLAAAVLLVVGGVAALIWLADRDDITPADDEQPAGTEEPTTEEPATEEPPDDPARTALTEGDGYETSLVAETTVGFGNAELVLDEAAFDALWTEWNPGPDRPAVDFARSVALVTTRPDNACPDTLVRFDRTSDPGAWRAVFEDLSAACEDPLLSWIYVVAIDRAVLGETATIVLPAQEVFDVPEQRLEYVAADRPTGSSSTVDVEKMEDTGIVLDLPAAGEPALHNTSSGLLWVVAHDDGTVSVLPATIDAGRVGGEDAGSVTPQQRLVYVASGGDLFFSGPMMWDAHGRTIAGGRTNDLAGLVGRVDGDEVRVWSTDAQRVEGAPDPAPDRIGTSPDRTLAELRRAAGEPIDTPTFFTLSSSGPVWRHLDATLVVEDGVGRICELPTDVPVDEQTGCDDESAFIATLITSSEPTITTWFHPPILAFQDPLRGFTSFVPLGGTSSRNDADLGPNEPAEIEVLIETVDVCAPGAPEVVLTVGAPISLTVELGDQIGGLGSVELPPDPAQEQRAFIPIIERAWGPSWWVEVRATDDPTILYDRLEGDCEQDGSQQPPVEQPVTELTGRQFRLDDPAAVNDSSVIPRSLGLVEGYEFKGGPLLSDEAGSYGIAAEIAASDRSRPSLLVLAQLVDPTLATPVIVEITDIVEVELTDGKALSIHHIGCGADGQLSPNVIGVVDAGLEPATTDMRVPAIRAWQYTRAGLTELDAEAIRCELAG